MKILKKIKQNKILYILISIGILSSCSDYLDVDTDTDNPKTAPLNQLLTNIEVSVGNVNDFNVYSGEILSTYVHQFTSREEEDQYGVKVDNINMKNDWDNIYLTLNDIESLIKQATSTGDLVYVGIAQLQKAYILSVAVDLWGDVPFTEATKSPNKIISPKFDNQKLIYKAVFELIELGKTNVLSNAGLKFPSIDDLFYGGNVKKWEKFANTFKLKLYNQTRLTSNFDQIGFNTLNALPSTKFFESAADDFQFNHFNNIAPTNDRNKLFIASYESTQFGSYQSPWFYELMQGKNPNINNLNSDPRIPYYFYKQLAPNVAFPPDQGSATNPGADYWNKSTGFFSIRFGSTGPDRDKSAENSYTYPGIYVCGGRYDDNLGGTVSTLKQTPANGPGLQVYSGTGAAPHRILTYDEMLFVQAELIQVGKLTGNASNKLQDAIKANIIKVDLVVLNTGTLQIGIPTLVGKPSVTTFISNVITEFNAASVAKKLEIIMTQKWIASYGDPMDIYTDYRRTGYPILANPLGTSPEYQLNNSNAFPLNDAQTVLNNAYQVSFFWPQSELNVNLNSPGQKNPTTYKIFWN